MPIPSTLGTITIAAALTLGAGAALADPAGSYRVDGTGPDGSSYTGTASIEATGDTYQVTWLIAGQKFVGTAVGNDDFFAVAYRSGTATGIAAYGKDGRGWTGVWTYSGGRKVGAEKLTRR